MGSFNIEVIYRPFLRNQSSSSMNQHAKNEETIRKSELQLVKKLKSVKPSQLFKTTVFLSEQASF